MEKSKLNIQLFASTGCTVTVKSITQDIVNNCSTITIHGKLTTSSSSYNYGGAYMTPTISNQPVVGSQTSSQTLAKKKYNIDKNGTKEDDWTFTVYHNNDGSCTNLTIAMRWYVSNNSNGTVYVSGGYTPTTIPRASDVSANNGTLNTQMTINISRKDSSFKHTLRYVCGSASGWIKDVNNKVDTSAYWTPPLSLASQNQSGESVSCTIYCQTYNSSGSAIGSETSTTISLAIPSMPPINVNISTPSDYNNYKNTYGVFIQNKSRIRATLSGTPQYTTIKSYSWQIRQNNSTGTILASGNSSTIDYSPTISGTLYISGTVTDNRNKSTSTSTTVSVTAYSAPTCSLAVSRVDSTSASYTMSGSGTPLSVSGYTANVITYTLKRENTTVRSTNDGTVYTGTDTIEDQSYTYILTASDTISGVTDIKQVPISTTFTLMNFSASGKAMAIGKASEAGANEKLFEVGMETFIDGGVTITGSTTLKGRDFVLGTSETSSDDSGDIVYVYGNGNEKARIWTINNMSSSNKRLQYRSYDSNGNQLINSELALTDDIYNFMKIIRCVKTIIVPSGDSSHILFALPTISGYQFAGIMTYSQGYADQWLISYGYYGGNIVAMVHSKYPSELSTQVIPYLLYLKSDYYNEIATTINFDS